MRVILGAFLITGVFCQAGALYKSFELFKRNQWQVNKVLKSQDQRNAERMDEIETAIIKQNEVIRHTMSQVDKLTKNVDESNKVIKSSYETTRRLEVQLDESARKLNLAAKEIEELKKKLESSEIKVSLLEDRLSDAEHADFSSQTGPETIEDILVKDPVKKDAPKTEKALKPSPSEPVGKNPILIAAPKMPSAPEETEEPKIINAVAPSKPISVPGVPTEKEENGESVKSSEGFAGLLSQLKDRPTIAPTEAPALLGEYDEKGCAPIAQVSETAGAFVHTSWVDGGDESLTSFNAFAYVPIPDFVPSDAKVLMKFNGVASDIQVWQATAKRISEDGDLWLFTPTDMNVVSQNAGDVWKFNFIATVASSSPKMELSFCKNFDAPEVADTVMLFDNEIYLPEDEEEAEYDEDEILLDYDLSTEDDSDDFSPLGLIQAPRPAPSSNFRPPLGAPINSFKQQTSNRRVVSGGRCSKSAGQAPVNPAQISPNFTASPSEELEIFQYDLNEVLHKSILFYEAQRAGKLPENNRVPWRGDSVLTDGCDIGVDLSGGWFDAGDHVKYTFPAAFTATMLAWSILDFEDAYQAANELENALDQVRWKLEWLLAAHLSPNELVVMVGDPKADHGRWGPPETLSLRRPTYVVNQQKPGTEPAAETSAALAAGYLLFKTRDAEFAERCLTSSKQLLEFSDRNRQNYHKSVPEVSEFYKSWSGYEDELCWATAWVYRATGDAAYGRLARHYYDTFNCGKIEESFDWDKKHAGVQLLMAQITGEDKYRQDVNRHAVHLITRQASSRAGLLWFHKWGSLRIANNWGAFLLGASQLEPKLPRAGEFALKGIEQLGYSLGDQGRSYVVGFGQNPPVRPHHRAASCPGGNSDCGNMLHSSKANAWVLFGALVGGPDKNDRYTDKRSDYVMNEVAIDYNACYQYSAAALKHILING